MAERSGSKLKVTSEKREDNNTTTRTPEDSSNLTEFFQAFIDTVVKEQNIIPGDRPEPHPDFLPTLDHLSNTLFKLVSLTTGKPHPHCPDSVLRYHLLTSSQLDDIARHYHQIWPPLPETYRYPKPIIPWIGTEEEQTIDIERKRERIGQFIGLRKGGEKGCVNGRVLPASEAAVKLVAVIESPLKGKHDPDIVDSDGDEAVCEGIVIQMQKDWEEALERARRDEGYSGMVRFPKA
jgi:hypothetical protein